MTDAAIVQIDGHDTGHVQVTDALARVIHGRLHDAHKGFLVRGDGQTLHAAVGTAIGELCRQGVIVTLVIGERVDPAYFLALGIEMHDVRAILVGYPEGAVAERHQAFAIQPVIVQAQRVGFGVIGLGRVFQYRGAIGVVGRLSGAAQRAAVRQAGDQGAIRALEQNGIEQHHLALGGDFIVPDAGRVIRGGEFLALALAAGEAGIGAAIGERIKTAVVGRVAGHGGAEAAVAYFEGLLGVGIDQIGAQHRVG